MQIHGKMTGLWIFCQTGQGCMFLFNNLHNVHKRQQCMGKFKRWKRFPYNIRAVAIPFGHFRKFDFYNFLNDICKQPYRKTTHFLWQILKFLIKFHNLTKRYHVGGFDGMMAALWIFFVFYTRVYFLCLLLSLQRFTVAETLK